MILSRLVNPRASRIADIVASVPELHMRIFCTDGTAERIGNAKAGSMLGRLFDRADNRRMSVAENSRAPGANVIDVLVAIDIINAGAPGAVDEERFTAYPAKCAHRRVHAAWNKLQRLREEFLRALCLNTGHL